MHTLLTALICDQRIMLNGFYFAKNYPRPISIPA